MTIQYNTPADFDLVQRRMIEALEGMDTQPNDIGDGTITYGHGYTFVRGSDVYKTLAADLAAIGVTLTTAQEGLLKEVAKAHGRDAAKPNSNNWVETSAAIVNFKKTWTQPALSSNNAYELFKADAVHFSERIKTIFKNKLGGDQAKADTLYNSLQGTREWAAILCMGYVAETLIGTGFVKALSDGNRAEAWFEMRYGWSDNNAQYNNGWAARHYLESTVFGLYDNAANVTAVEAKQVYEMLSKNRAAIFAREGKYGVLPTGVAGTRDMINQDANAANKKADYLAALTAANSGSVQTITEVLTPAYTAFVTYANTLHGTGAPDIDKALISNAASIYFQGDPFSQTLDARVDDARTGQNLSNNLIVGGAGLDTEYGGKGADYLMGLGGVDSLDGGEGDDTLVGGTGDDKLQGGAGTDVYAFTAGDGKDTIIDSDGLGSIVIGGNPALSGATKADYKLLPNGQGQWSVNNGATIYTLDEILRRLVITGSSLGADSQTTVNLDAAGLAKLTGAEGYLGIKLERPVKTAFGGAGSANPFNTDILPTNLTATVLEGGGASCRLFLAAPAKSGDTLILNASGTGVSLCGVVLGDDTVPLSAGVTLTLLEGQTEIAFAIVNTADLSANTNLTLSASYTSDGQTVTSSNSETITLVDAGAPSHTFIGDQRGKLIGTETQTDIGPSDPRYGTFVWAATSWAADGTLTGGKPEADFNDVITATAENDRIDGKGGNDALDGKVGNDQIDGGDGDDLIAGGVGSDAIQGGAGNDIIFGATSLKVNQRERQDDTWTPPSGQTVIAKGSNWGYSVDEATHSANYPKYLTSLTPDTDGDVIDAGAGDDEVVAGLGDDRVEGAAGNDSLTGGGGADVLEGGDGADQMFGDDAEDVLAAGFHGCDASRCRRVNHPARSATNSIAGYASSMRAERRFGNQNRPGAQLRCDAQTNSSRPKYLGAQLTATQHEVTNA